MSNNEADRLAERIRQWHTDFVEWFRDMELPMSDRAGLLFDRIEAIERAALAKQQAPEATAEPAAVPVGAIYPTAAHTQWGEDFWNFAQLQGVADQEYQRGFSHGVRFADESLTSKDLAAHGTQKADQSAWHTGLDEGRAQKAEATQATTVEVRSLQQVGAGDGYTYVLSEAEHAVLMAAQKRSIKVVAPIAGGVQLVPTEATQAAAGGELDEDEVLPQFVRWHTSCGRKWADDEFTAFIGGAEWALSLRHSPPSPAQSPEQQAPTESQRAALQELADMHQEWGVYGVSDAKCDWHATFSNECEHCAAARSAASGESAESAEGGV